MSGHTQTVPGVTPTSFCMAPKHWTLLRAVQGGWIYLALAGTFGQIAQSRARLLPSLLHLKGHAHLKGKQDALHNGSADLICPSPVPTAKPNRWCCVVAEPMPTRTSHAAT